MVICGLSCREYCDHYCLSYCHRSDINEEIESGVGKIEGIRRGGKIMLRKLMKYDLKYYRKIMLPLWAVLIIYGIVHESILCSIMKHFMIISQ